MSDKRASSPLLPVKQASGDLERATMVREALCPAAILSTAGGRGRGGREIDKNDHGVARSFFLLKLLDHPDERRARG